MRQLEVVVVGGGLAGLAAAVELVDSGISVTLVESRPKLGGAVHTLPQRDGDPEPSPDNGQHVALGSCTEYVAFLERIGSASSLARLRLKLPVIDSEGRVSSMGYGLLGLLGYRHLSLRERIRILVVLKRISHLNPQDHKDLSFAELLLSLGQQLPEIDRFWEIFMRPALNLPCSEASADLGVFTTKTALLGSRAASDLLMPLAPLGAMHGEAAKRVLDKAGAKVLMRVRATRVHDEGVELADGKSLSADAVIVATQAVECSDLLGEKRLGLGDSPIVSVHLWFDRIVMDSSLAAFIDSPAHWVFDRGRLVGNPPERGQYLTVVSSGVPDLLEVRGKNMVDLIAEELTQRLGKAELIWSRVSREPRATFAGRPGTALYSPLKGQRDLLASLWAASQPDACGFSLA